MVSREKLTNVLPPLFCPDVISLEIAMSACSFIFKCNAARISYLLQRICDLLAGMSNSVLRHKQLHTCIQTYPYTGFVSYLFDYHANFGEFGAQYIARTHL